MGPSTALLLENGFQPISKAHALTAKFYSARVFKVRGLQVEDRSVLVTPGVSQGTNYVLALGTNVKQLEETLFSLISDNPKIDSENIPPGTYLALHIGPTTSHVCTDGYAKQEEETIISAVSRMKCNTLDWVGCWDGEAHRSFDGG